MAGACILLACSVQVGGGHRLRRAFGAVHVGTVLWRMSSWIQLVLKMRGHNAVVLQAFQDVDEAMGNQYGRRTSPKINICKYVFRVKPAMWKRIFQWNAYVSEDIHLRRIQ